jgi:hypothetical protein
VRRAGRVRRMGGAGDVGRCEGKRILVRTRNRRENNIKIYVKGTGWGELILLGIRTGGGLLLTQQ